MAGGPRPGRFGFGLGGNQGGGVEGKRGLVKKSCFSNYFRHDESETDLTDDWMCTVFLIFCPNRFRLEMEPRELIWKSVTANLHRLF